MDETVLLTAFIAFAILFVVLAFVLRKMTVQDFFDDRSSSLPSFSEQKLPSFAPAEKNTPKVNSTLEKNFKFDREGINKIGKALGIIGTIMLFAPLPSSLDGVSLGIAFLGYMIAKFSSPPKGNKKKVSQNPTAQKIRQLAGKPEYQEALKILYEDHGDKTLITDQDKYRRATSYLQSKGVSFKEAQENLRLLLVLLNRQHQQQ